MDLVNTLWRGAEGEVDLLATDEGLAQWLAERSLPRAGSPSQVRAALRAARGALSRAFEREEGAEDELNVVLSRALIVRRIESGRACEQKMFPDEAWRPAWLAVDDYLRLRASGEESIRRCGGVGCILYFFDPGGRRRWCSMDRCGNRAKARKHYYTMRQAPGATTLEGVGSRREDGNEVDEG